MLIAHYRSGTEFIEITRNNGLYYINYGAGYSKCTGKKYYNCTTLGFEKITDAVETLKRHRPQAERIKDYCSRCKLRKMLSYDYDNNKTEYVDCNGELYETCYTGCIYCK